MRLKALGTLACVVCLTVIVAGQVAFREPPITNDNWTKPFPALRVVGNLYYVGTYDLAAYLITTDQGHMLINTGVASSVPMIRSSIESLGFTLSDVKLLLATHAHYDHVAGMAALKRLTGARMLMHEADASVLEDGGNSDYRFFPKGRGAIYEPVKVDQRLKDGDSIRLGSTVLTAHHHPGHTKGSTSFTFTTSDAGRDYRVGIVNMNGLNEGVKLLDSPGYPAIIEEVAGTFAKQKMLSPEVWVSSHAGQFGLHDKYKPGDAYRPDRFVDPEGYRTAVQRTEARYLEQLQEERRARSSR